MAYLLDSDVFIQACNMHYSFTVCPGFWEWIGSANSVEKLFSIDKVQKEIGQGYGDLTDWANARTNFFLRSSDVRTFESLKLLATWASKNYKPAAYAKFFQSADLVLVGFAHAHGHIVVTQEKYCSGAQVKIPNACEAIGVECINTWQLLLREQVRFVLPGDDNPRTSN